MSTYKSIYHEYFSLLSSYQKKYGKNVCLLMEVGSFFEIYTYKNNFTDIIEHDYIVDLTQLCNLSLVEKKATYEDLYQIMMAGFRNYMLDKYVKLLVDADTTVVVYVQEKDGDTTRRVFHTIYSPGTYVSYETETCPQITNNLMCVWFNKYLPYRGDNLRVSLLTGVSVSNIFTGECNIYEYDEPYVKSPTTFDNLERLVSTYCPSELIIIHDFTDAEYATAIQYSGIKCPTIHSINFTDPANEKAINCMSQRYMAYIINNVYGDDAYTTCAEFHNSVIATQSLCYLLNFIYDHNGKLVKNMKHPIFNNTGDRLLLANHTLKQLNIIDDNSADGKSAGMLSSVSAFLNKCVTAMGRRRLQSELLNPTKNVEWLETQYSIIETVVETPGKIDEIRKLLKGLRDLEKICTQINIKKIYPGTIYFLFKNMETIQNIFETIGNEPSYAGRVSDYLIHGWGSHNDAVADCVSLINYIKSVLVVDACKGCQSMQSFDQNIIVAGVSAELDQLIADHEKNTLLFQSIKNKLNKAINQYDKPNIVTEYVKEHETEKSGLSLQITKKRGTLLKTVLKSLENSGTQYIMLDGNEKIHVNEITLINASTNTDEISCKLLTSVCRELYTFKEKINSKITEVYMNILETFCVDWLTKIEKIACYIAKLDVIMNKAHLSLKYNYCRPVIEAGEKGFVKARGLRHILIEHINQVELYVANDLTIGADGTNGILLYGTNAVGKTSLIRALGISVVIAQAGMWVPAQDFVYRPYDAIYSRILGNDNIFKGLSTFVVEMSELRVILKYSNANSLVLGDELCSGTENDSALSIFVAGLMDLHKKEASFIFATHYHEIVGYDEIVSLGSLKMKHLEVIYDRERDCLIYNRLLQDGPGNSSYGLEVCKSLHLPDEFMGVAYDIRNKYFPNKKGFLDHKTTVYNVNKIKGVCEVCKTEFAEEIHHMKQQKDADARGYVDGVHKNHPANLMALCEKCHDAMHRDEPAVSVSPVEPVKKKVVRKKTTKGYAVF